MKHIFILTVRRRRGKLDRDNCRMKETRRFLASYPHGLTPTHTHTHTHTQSYIQYYCSCEFVVPKLNCKKITIITIYYYII